MSLFRIHGISEFPSHFLNDKFILIQSGTILSCLNTENGEQKFVLQLTEYDSISCIASNPTKKIFVVAIKSINSSRIQVYDFKKLSRVYLLYTFDECSNVGYSHLDICQNGEFLIAISNVPDLEVELWSIEHQNKLSSSNVQMDDIKFVSFSPTSAELFMTANSHWVILWRIYYKFDQYFLTSTIHSLKQQRQIISITFGQNGTETVYINNFGELIIFDENSAQNNFTENIKHKFNVNQQSKAISKLLYCRYYFILIFAEDGIIQFISKHNFQLIYEFRLGSTIKHCIFTPNYRNLLIIDEEYQLLNCQIDKTLLMTNHLQFVDDSKLIQQDEICKFCQIKPNKGFKIVSLQQNDGILLHAQELQLIPLHRNDMNQNPDYPIFNISTIQIFHYNHNIDLVAFGFNDGHFGLCYVENLNSEHDDIPNLKLFFVERLFQHNIKQIEFAMNGTLIACLSSKEQKVWFICIQENKMPKVIGYYKLNKIPICCCWITDTYNNLKIILSFNNGFIATFDAPTDNNQLLLLESFYVDCEVDFSLTKIISDPNQNRIICLTQDNKLKAFLLDDDASIFPDDTFIFDDHMKTITDIEIHNDLLLTSSEDGLIIIRHLSNPSHIILSIYAHDSSPQNQGILTATFTNSGSKIVSVGYDGSVISWQLETDIISQTKLKQIDCPLTKQYLNELMEIMIDEENVLTFEEKQKTQIMNQKKDEFEPTLIKIKEELKTLRKNYDIITDKLQNATDLEKLDEKELIVDKKQYKDLLNTNKQQINKIGQNIKYENIGKQLIMRRIKEQCWDSMKEKLQIVKGIKDSKQVTTFPMLSHNKNDVNLIKKLEFLRKINLIEQEWSSKTQDRVKREFDIKYPLKDGAIKYIWDINELSKEEKERRKQILLNGGSEEDEKNNNNDDDDDDGDNKENDKKDDNKQQEADKNKEKTAKNDGENKDDEEDEEDGIKFPISQHLKNLLYHPMKLYTNFSKRIQIKLLNLRIRQIKIAFNRQVEQIFKLKTAEVERINEKALEISDIQRELQMTDPVFMAHLADDENKDGIFMVNDQEIKIEKVLTEKQLFALKQQELDRKNREKNVNNDITERALYDMMNNTLDSKDEVERLQDTLKKPEFMDVLEESQLTDQQKQEIALYEEKKNALFKAKEVRTKLLKTRLKSLKNDVSDICKHFDTKLKALYNVRLAVMEDIYVHELMLIHLGNDIIEYEQYEKRINNMNLELMRLCEDQEKADKTFIEFNGKLEESKKKLEDLYIAEKYLDKVFKKEMGTFGGDYFDYLYKLFRGKKAIPPKHPLSKMNSIGLERRTSYSTITNDSNSDVLSIKRSLSKIAIKHKKSVAKSLKNIQEIENDGDDNDDGDDDNNDTETELLINDLKEDDEIDIEQELQDENIRKEQEIINPYFEIKAESNDELLLLSNIPKPIDLNITIWNRFLELRKLKITKDKEIFDLNHAIASMQAEVNALQSNQEIICQSISEIERASKLLSYRRNQYKLDIELFFNCFQGCVEVEESPVVTDMRQSVLCNRIVIENLNKIILNAGNDQIQRLNEIKKFRRGINLLNWRAKILDLEYRYYTLLTTEYQLRRVTKKDQEIIKAGGHDSKQQNEVSSLERKIEFTKNTMDTKIKEKKKLLKKYKQRYNDINKSNKDLMKEIEKLETDVLSKQEILNIRSSVSVKDEKRQSIQKKMDAVVTRQRLKNLIQAQSEEIEFLRNELDRLRRRTFPSFSIADSHR